MLVTSLLVVVLDNTILNIALPTIQSDLDTSQSELVWAVDSYILVFAALLSTANLLYQAPKAERARAGSLAPMARAMRAMLAMPTAKSTDWARFRYCVV